MAKAKAKEVLDTRNEKVQNLEVVSGEVHSFQTDVSRFEAGRALKAMYPSENLGKEAEEIAASFDPSGNELAISGFGPDIDRSAVSKKVLAEVRSSETGPAQKALDEFTGVASSLDLSILKRGPINFLRINLWNPMKAFLRAVETAERRLDGGGRNLEVVRRKLVDDITSMQELEDSGIDSCREYLIFAYAGELVLEREASKLEKLKKTNSPNDIQLPAKIDEEQTIVNRMGRKVLDLKASAMRTMLSSKIAGAGQKGLVIIHDDVQYAQNELLPQFADQVAAAIILFRGKEVGEQGKKMRKASADLAESTGLLLGEVSGIGQAYLTEYEDDLRGLVALRDGIVVWSKQSQEVGAKIKVAREDAEKRMQEISDSLQAASQAFSTEKALS